MSRKIISCIIPCFNESEVLQEFYRRIDTVSGSLEDYLFEYIFINDGSNDETPHILNKLAENDPRAKILHFAKNRGHQAAITAGMDFCTGNIIIIIDADLQDPPELIQQIVEQINLGFDVIHMQRRKREGESWYKRTTAIFFYWMMNNIGRVEIIDNSGDFRGFTRPVLNVIKGFRERHRFVRGLFAEIGFKQTIVQFDRDSRYAGVTKYPTKKMVALAWNAILGFSSTPLNIIIWVSFALWSVSLVYLSKALIGHFVYNVTVPGWTSIIILMTFYTGIIMFCLGIIGSYIGKIFEQGQKRPLYWINDAKNIDPQLFNQRLEEVQLSGHTFNKSICKEENDQS